MTPWNLAIGNLTTDNAATDVPPPPRHAERPAPRAKVERAFCPHCGHRVRSPQGPRPWSADEDKTLRARLADGVKHEHIARELGRPVSSIKSRINTLGIEKGRS